MNIFFWIVDLIIPITMIIIGIIFENHPPKEINYVYGYRTKRSMASQEAWDLAHKLCGDAWRTIGIILFIFVVVEKLIVQIDPASLSLINVGISLIALITPIFFIERKLKNRFGK